ncbi:hypothetical protein DAPPUDRAFT_100990 [Daphnia pulex]|uniref:Uncharacterized protein n=1 Tax=Daphnia pulex TaxID=6669 RepID=E9GBW3_DAPPU|nr:hypothetical protein DAPPUDRAFT_100990 [Daphnia pulex]|eukprot:EFX83086.1 hypothetical protein DAPPUDRAFT_100990 [Daphnia pulex]
MKNIHGLSERIANRLKEKGFARVEEKIFQAGLLDECTGGKATGHSLGNNNYKNENETESLEKAALYKVVVDSDEDKTLSSLLIKKGAELDKGKCDEMHLASRYAEMKGIVDNLLGTVLHGTTAPNCTSDDNNENMAKEVLEEAFIHSDVEKVRILIEMGADLSKTTWGGGRNALHAASIGAKTTEILDVILATGEFDINVAKNEETTELIDVILDTEQCNINPVDSDGRTPLHYAIKRPDPVTINARRLIKMGADPGIADENGVTPLHMAARNAESMDLIELLLNTEAVDVNCVDKQGQTPLACARDNTHGLADRIIARLREYDDME